MSRIRSKDTKPEIIVKKFLFQHGFRYRLHVKELPGKPDIVLPKYKIVIFVNGCFWHGHKKCVYFIWPKSNKEWWRNKIANNRRRDVEKVTALEALGWKVFTVWECDLKHDKREDTLIQLIGMIQNKY